MYTGGMITKGAYTFSMSAEVGLLTRNIVIEGEDYPSLIEQSYGARVLVGRYRVEDVDYIGGYWSLFSLECTIDHGWNPNRFSSV